MPDAISIIPLSGFPLVKPGDDLCALLLHALHTNSIELQDDDIPVLAQKTISKAESRYVDLNPFISVDPILALPEVREALIARQAPVIAVSPIIGGRAVNVIATADALRGRGP